MHTYTYKQKIVYMFIYRYLISVTARAMRIWVFEGRCW